MSGGVWKGFLGSLVGSGGCLGIPRALSGHVGGKNQFLYIFGAKLEVKILLLC